MPSNTNQIPRNDRRTLVFLPCGARDLPASGFCAGDFSSERLANGARAPSFEEGRYEPCGLNQMYSLKYGTVPIVRKTGGLADSVKLFDPATGEGTVSCLSTTRRTVSAGLSVLRSSSTVTARPGAGSSRTGWRRIFPGSARPRPMSRSIGDSRRLELLDPLGGLSPSITNS